MAKVSSHLLDMATNRQTDELTDEDMTHRISESRFRCFNLNYSEWCQGLHHVSYSKYRIRRKDRV